MGGEPLPPSMLCDRLADTVPRKKKGDEAEPQPEEKKPAAKKTAARPAKRRTAKRAPTLRRLPAAEIARRDAEIVRLRISFPNLTWEQIVDLAAENRPKWRLTPEHARKMYAAWSAEKQSELAEPDALELVQEHIAGFRDVREQAAQAAREANGGFAMRPSAETGEMTEITITPQPHLILGALRMIADMRGKEIALLQETGLMPKNLGRLELELDLRHTTQVFIAILDKYVPKDKLPDAELELLEVLEGQVRNAGDLLAKR